MISADAVERRALLTQNRALAGVELALTLKDQCYAVWYVDPGRAVRAAAALATLAEQVAHPEVSALADWAGGIAALAEGDLESALAALDRSATGFEQLGQPWTAASTQVARLIALAMLGRYDEATTCGLAARTTLLAHDDEVAAARIEINLGNIALRRDQYSSALAYFRAAHSRLLSIDEPTLLVAVELGIADVLTEQRQFAAAQELYTQALHRAELAGLETYLATAERNLGNMALAQGHYHQALAYLECYRRRTVALGLPHESAAADLELAEVYLELNLAPEAAAIFARVIPLFTELGMRSEHAWALAHDGQAALLLGDTTRARARFVEARSLFKAEGNQVNAALVALFESQLRYHEGEYEVAASIAAGAERIFQAGGNPRRRLVAVWLQGEALRAGGALEPAAQLLATALREAEVARSAQVIQRCTTSLGLLALVQGDAAGAEAHFRQAIATIEQLRAPLPAEEFRTAFLVDKLSPFNELVRLCLDTERVHEAIGMVERARSRSLLETLGGAVQHLRQPRDAFEGELLSRLVELRTELNWLYQRSNRALEHEQKADTDLSDLQAAAQECETAILNLTRQLQQRGGADLFVEAPFDIHALQTALDAETALVEYFSLDDELLGFVVTTEAVHVVRNLSTMPEIEDLVEWFRFQVNALRGDLGHSAEHQTALLRLARTYLAQLYDALLRPLEALLGERRLVIVPHRALHYVPFRALFDGEQYVIERREVCTAPSAAVLHHCLKRPESTHARSVFVGVPDARAPRVRDEILTIAPLCPDQVVLLDDAATLAAVQQHASSASVLHLACHGQFRADSPLFSSLRLADGWLTVHDAYGLDLTCDLVVLSACETGVSAIAPGDELIGLARGFFTAGAPTLIVSLWTVDDTTTAELMTTMYRCLQAGQRPGAALRTAQCELMHRHPHPFYWAPFVLMGRW